FPNRKRVHTDVYINAGQQRAMRAPGHPQGCFLTEILMDELADRVKIDPVEFRIRNAPPIAPNAQWIKYFQEGARRFGWEKRHPTRDPTPGPSTTAASVSPAIRVTCTDALDQLFAKVAPTVGVQADDLVAEGGRIRGATDASKSLAWKDACKLLGTEPISVDGKWQDGLSGAGTSGVQFSEVTVDIETGIVRIKRILAMQDCGLIVDRLTAESQVYGGVIAAINFALYEDRILDRVTGQMVNPNMEFYLVPGISDIPKIDMILVDTPASRARGVIGIGEPPTVSTSAAIANAVRNATGATIRSLPLTPAKVLQAIEQERAGGTN